ncbi:pyridoxamine 5'-phosphate oxidase family protein [Streptomyces sp. B4I13]|uniref:pyridoxamine 5'-phosphate oxidase family protein n=1 Tax=Streptomyces sp. B4I13 TaxID=3042271 RepID=UPI003593FF9A
MAAVWTGIPGAGRSRGPARHRPAVAPRRPRRPRRAGPDGAVLLSTSAAAELVRAVDGAVVAFETDDVDAAGRSGWSVVVTGPAAVVAAPPGTSAWVCGRPLGRGIGRSPTRPRRPPAGRGRRADGWRRW